MVTFIGQNKRIKNKIVKKKMMRIQKNNRTKNRKNQKFFKTNNQSKSLKINNPN